MKEDSHRLLHFELSTGASGDKMLGALLEVCELLGVAAFEELAALGHALVPSINIERSKVMRSGIAATHLVIEEPGAPVRHMREIREMIETAATDGILTARAAELALEAFGYVAQAEATVHNRPVDHVHFHEVGAADSILDIVGSCFLFDALAAEKVFATPMALGSGTLTCSHGVMPVPAPATALIIEGLPVYAGTVEFELTTPTGAALVRTFVTQFAPLPYSVVQAVGYGAGSKDFPTAANVVRILACEEYSGQENQQTFESQAQQAFARDLEPFTLEGCILLESNIDHLSPEALAHVCDDLLLGGAFDVWQEPITMKKGRLAVKLCLLCSPAEAQGFSKQIIKSTGSLGVRQRYIERIIAPREKLIIDNPYGAVPYKVARFIEPDEEILWLRPEHDAVSALAHKHQLNYQDLYEELIAICQNALS